MSVIVDLQGFRRSTNIFVVKEVAIVGVGEDKEPQVYHFQPPCKWSKLLQEEQSSNRWLELNFHGIPWQSGSIKYSEVVRVLRNALKDVSSIYVKGLEKKKWLEETLGINSVHDMEDIGCPALKKLKYTPALCHIHPLCWNPKCAARNALALKNWLIKYKKN